MSRGREEEEDVRATKVRRRVEPGSMMGIETIPIGLPALPPRTMSTSANPTNVAKGYALQNYIEKRPDPNRPGKFQMWYRSKANMTWRLKPSNAHGKGYYKQTLKNRYGVTKVSRLAAQEFRSKRGPEFARYLDAVMQKGAKAITRLDAINAIVLMGRARREAMTQHMHNIRARRRIQPGTGKTSVKRPHLF